MAGTHVHSVSQSYGHTVSWSEDNRIAVSADEEIQIMVITSSCRNTSPNSSVKVVKSLSAKSLSDRKLPWGNLFDIYSVADASVQSEFIAQWTYSDIFEPSVHTSWAQVAWSPAGVNPHHRCVLAALSLDHRLLLLDDYRVEWNAVADLSDQLASGESENFMGFLKNTRNKDTQLKTVLEQMYSIAPTAVAWSDIMGEKIRHSKEESMEIAQENTDHTQKTVGEMQNYVLLFAGMKNGDIVTWKCCVPFSSQDDCQSLGRQPTHGSSPVTSLAWTTLSERNTGVLAVGHANGNVSVLHVHLAVSQDTDQCLQVTEKIIQEQADFLPVTCMTWTSFHTGGMLLLHGKGPAVAAHSITITDNINSQTGIKLQQSTFSDIGNWFHCTGLQCRGSTVLLSSEDGNVRLLTVPESADSSADVRIECSKRLAFDLSEPSWGCLHACLSPSATFCLALFRPNFNYNSRNNFFARPVHVHLCPVVDVDMTSLDTVLVPDKALRQSTEDILELARRVVCGNTKDQRSITELKNQLLSDRFTASAFGRQLARYLLGTVGSLCKTLNLETEEVTVVYTQTTEQLLCEHIKEAWQRYKTRHKTEKDEAADFKILKAMLTWIEASSSRKDNLGSEVMSCLLAACSKDTDSSDMLCSICDTKQNFVGPLDVECSNKHSFGICVKMLQVCDDVPFQVCQTCGVCARAYQDIANISWIPGIPSRCTLCGGCFTSSQAEIIT